MLEPDARGPDTPSKGARHRSPVRQRRPAASSQAPRLKARKRPRPVHCPRTPCRADQTEHRQSVALPDVPRRERDAENADWDVDQKDPVPGSIGGDEAAKRRTHNGPDQRWHGYPGHGVDKCPFVNGSDQHQPTDGGHHRPAHALDHPGNHERNHDPDTAQPMDPTTKMVIAARNTRRGP